MMKNKTWYCLQRHYDTKNINKMFNIYKFQANNEDSAWEVADEYSTNHSSEMILTEEQLIYMKELINKTIIPEFDK